MISIGLWAAPGGVGRHSRPEEGSDMNILVVDDSVFMRRSLTKMIESDPDLRVVDTARDGEDAVEKARLLKPDLITMDVEMPKMDGIEALRKIMATCPTTVLMVSSLTSKGSREALKAMRLGAADFIAKDASFVSLNVDSMRDGLIAKIKAIGPMKKALRVGRSGATPSAPPAATSTPAFGPDQFDLAVIGSSTGGPPVVEKIAGALPSDLAVPMVVAQHMPGVFTKSLAERLNIRCAVRVFEAENGMPLRPGTLYISPGGRQTRVRSTATSGWFLRVDDNPKDAMYKPSVNVLFASAVRAAGGRLLATVLTGMGDDGTEGAEEIARAGGVILTQSAATCIVYGMPKSVDDAGLSSASLSPEQVCEALATLGSSGKGADQAEPRRRAG